MRSTSIISDRLRNNLATDGLDEQTVAERKEAKMATETDRKQHLEDLVLLQGLARDVEREVLAVDNTLNEGEVVGDEVLAVVHDEHPPHVQLDVVRLLLLVEQVEGCTLRHEEHSLQEETFQKSDTSMIIFHEASTAAVCMYNRHGTHIRSKTHWPHGFLTLTNSSSLGWQLKRNQSLEPFVATSHQYA